MNNPTRKFLGLRGAIAILLSLIVAGFPFIHRIAFAGVETPAQAVADTSMYSVTAIPSPQGVLLRWKTSFELDNVGFNVYRECGGKRTRVNREIVPGSMFLVGQNVALQAGHSYSWFDAEGTADCLYSIEAVSLNGTVKSFGKVASRWQDRINVEGELVDSNRSALQADSGSQKEYPAALPEPGVAEGQIEDQWLVVAQPGLKIAIKKEGWYRVTQDQMSAAGFIPVVDIANLRLFLNARELPIRTNKSRGQFASGDYIEFYGSGLDTATTDSNIYYLIAGSTEGSRIPSAGKRVSGGVRSESAVPATEQPSLLPSTEYNPEVWFWWPSSANDSRATTVADKPAEEERAVAVPTAPDADGLNVTRDQPRAIPAEPIKSPSDPKTTPAVKSSKKEAVISSQPNKTSATPARSTQRKSGTRKKKRAKRKYAHAVAAANASGNAVNFDYTVQRKDRSIYFVGLLNGDTENYFGSVLSTSAVNQTLTVLNPDSSSGGMARLQIVLQGASSATHVVDVQFNGVALGTMTFFGLDRKIQTFDVPAAQVLNGVNTVRLVPPPNGSGGLGLVDYIQLTYPHRYSADTGSLRFSLAAGQSARIDGFSTPAIRLLDYTNPLAIRVSRPLVESDGSGYTVQVPSSSTSRLLYAAPETQLDQPAALSLNRPSNLNAVSNSTDLLIIAHRSLIPSLDPLKVLRTSQGMVVSVVDVEDVYDEFSYGAHGPQAIKDFLAWASTRWSRAPRYIIFAGDASSDPRNYVGGGSLDLVPTKLVDATFNETSSDDWLCDFDNDGTADIPVGRLPVMNPAEANIVVSKIVNFAPANTPQTALLVADTQGTYYFNFEEANTKVQALLPAGMTVQRVDRRLEPSDAQARADILTKFNAGVALVNYSGHGNVDTWTGGSIFTSSDAAALTNGNKLPFVVVMDCLNGYFQDPVVQGIAEVLIKAPNGGAVASFASSGLTIPDGQHAMSAQLYATLYGSQPIALGDAIKIAKAATFDIDVRRTWIFFGDPSMKIR